MRSLQIFILFLSLFCPVRRIDRPTGGRSRSPVGRISFRKADEIALPQIIHHPACLEGQSWLIQTFHFDIALVL